MPLGALESNDLLPLLIAFADDAPAQQHFSFAGKIETVAIGSGPAGSHYQCGRLIVRHMGQYLPGHPA